MTLDPLIEAQQRVRRISSIVGTILAVAAVAVLTVSLIIGWPTYTSALERLGNLVAIPVAGAASVIVPLLMGKWLNARMVGHRAKAAHEIATAQADGLLPGDYVSSAAWDRQIIRALRYDKRIKLERRHIQRDLADLIQTLQNDKE